MKPLSYLYFFLTAVGVHRIPFHPNHPSKGTNTSVVNPEDIIQSLALAPFDLFGHFLFFFLLWYPSCSCC